MTPRLLLIAIAIVLAGCDPNGRVDKSVILPAVPAQYRSCAQAQLTKIPGSAVSHADIVKLIADIRKDSLTKDRCLKGVVRWYDNLAKVYARRS
jgi:hypothetical protein